MTEERVVIPIVRKATVQDIEVVKELDDTDTETCFQVATDEAHYRTLCEAGRAYLAFDGEMPIGYSRVDKIWPERVPLLSWIYVIPERRNARVGAALMEAVSTDLREQGYSTMLLSACTKRPEMIERFRRKGLHEAGRLTFPNGTDEVFFWQPI